MNDRKAIVFDFDGTIADTVPIITAIYSEMAAKNGWTPLTDKDYQELRKGTLSDARKWSGVKWWQLPLVVRSAKRVLKMESEKVKLFDGMSELIHELNKDDNVDLYVLSRNTYETVAAVLLRKKLSENLKVLTMRRVLGGKAVTLKKLLKKHKYKPENVWMVGDEIRDVQAAKRSGVKSIAVTWGVQDESILRNYDPDIVVSTVDELRDSLQS